MRDESDIYTFYVHLPILHGSFQNAAARIRANKSKKPDRIISPTITDLFQRRNACIVTGTGGSGKSMLVRHLVLDCLIKGFGVPVFVELRNLPNLEFPTSLEDYIFDHLATLDLKLSKDVFIESLKLGHFVIVLDGFDELTEKQQLRGALQIQRFTAQYSLSRILVTSRPDEMFASWHGFDNFTMAPLNKEEAIDFVEKQNYDAELAKMFRTELEKGGFEKHQSFLSNPLLLTIMMLTYGQSGSIPEKLGEFYENAFEALFQRHDVLKGGYTRPRSCNLDFSDFGRVFSAFCIHSYSDKRLVFSTDQLNFYVNRAKETTQLIFESESFIQDSVKAVCLLADEGLKKVFAHRSFQEYFAAKFIANCCDDLAVKLLEAAEARLGYDRLHALVYELNPGMFESQYLGPRLLKLKEAIGAGATVGIKAFTKYLKRNFDDITVENNTISWRCRVNGTTNFIDDRIISLINRLGLIQVSGDIEKIMHRYSGDKPIHFKVADLTFRNPFVVDLFQSKGPVSGKVLEDAFALGEKLIEKGKNRANSLSSVLAGFTRNGGIY